MRKVFANKWVVIALGFLALVLGALASSKLHQSMWLARSGSITVCMGLFLLTNAQLNGVYLVDVWNESAEFKEDDPRYYKQQGLPIPEWVTNHWSARQAVEFWGPLMTLVGTVVWGFGDLIQF